MAAHRAVDAEHKKYIQKAKVEERKGGGKPLYTRKAPGASKMPKWKAESEQFRAAMRAARGAKFGGAGYVAAAPAPPPDDYVLCKYCGRRFNEIAAERHIPFCERKFKESQMRVGGGKPKPQYKSSLYRR